MPLTYRSPLVVPAAARHTATVIFLHGLGDSGHGWSFAVENWRRRQRLDEVKFVFPHAPRISITVNRGMVMPGWYDIKEFSGSGPEVIRRNEDEQGILQSQAYVHGLIQQEIDAGIPADRIVLGGFSQGGAVSIFAGLTAKVKLAGIVALSAYLLLSSKFAEFVPQPDVNKQTPVFMGHGDSDGVVHTRLGQLTHDALEGMGYDVKLTVYPDLEHSASPEELDDVEAFLTARLPRKGEEKSEL